MAVYFLDASAAVKAYVEEEGSDRVEEILNHAEEAYLGRVGIVEVAAALFGKAKAGELEPGQAASTVALLREDVNAVYQVVEVDPVTADRAVEVAAHHRLRAYDCLQLATALLLQEQRDALGLASLIFASSDKELGDAARAEGLTVEDPAI